MGGSVRKGACFLCDTLLRAYGNISSCVARSIKPTFKFSLDESVAAISVLCCCMRIDDIILSQGLVPEGVAPASTQSCVVERVGNVS